MSFLPQSKEVIKESIVVLGGAILAAFVIGQFPQLRAWMRAQWGGSNPAQNGQQLP